MNRETWQADKNDVEAIVAGRHRDAFGVLGLHDVDGQWGLRAFIPHAESVSAFTLDGTDLGVLYPRHAGGVFEGKVKIDRRQPIKLHAKNAGGEWDVFDPYSFGPVLGPMDDYFIGEGSHLRLFDKLGAHEMEFEGIHGTHFAVWAPNAQRVSVVGSFNQWDGRRNPMRNRSGIWEVFIPVLGTGTIYKYEIVGPDGTVLPLKADPFARQAEMRPRTASVVPDPTPFTWTDQKYMEDRASHDWRRTPMSTYEVHLGSWRRPGGSVLS